MSSTDIIARLKLNAQNFSAELTKELGGVEKKFGSSGSVIGHNLSQGIGGGLQDAASRVPVLGGALAGLSGTALLTAAGIGAVGLALASGISEAEGYSQAVKGVDSVLRATGNTTGYTRDQLIGFANDLEGAIATPAEDIMNAEKVLSSFGGVAGDVFKRTIKDAADLAAVYGGDLAGNTEKLGTVLQNLAQGEVTGLSKSFKFLGVETLTAIENLAKAGDTAAAQELLLSSLEKRVGGTAGDQATGLTGAFFRLSDAVGDASRELAVSSGAYDASASAVDRLASSVNDLAARYHDAKSAKELFDDTVAFFSPGGLEPKKKPDDGPEKLDADPYGLNKVLTLDSVIARNAADQAYASAEKLRQQEKAKEDAAKAARKAEQDAAKARADGDREAARAAEEAAQRLETLRGKYGDVTSSAREYQKALDDIIKLEMAGKVSPIEAAGMQVKIAGQQNADQQDAMRKAITAPGMFPGLPTMADQLREIEDQKEAARELADYQKEEGVRAIRAVGRSMETIFGRSIGRGLDDILYLSLDGKQRDAEQAQTAGVFAKLSKGIGLSDDAAGKIGEIAGKVSRGAQTGDAVNNIDKQLGLSKALGLKSSKMGAEIGGSIGSLTGIPGGDIVGSILGSVVGGLMKKTKSGSATLGFSGDGTLGTVSTSGNSGKMKKAASASADALAASLQSMAEALGGDLNGAISTSFGMRKKSYRVDTTGQGRTKGAGVLDFGDDQQAAIEAALKDALNDGVITGISDASKRILAAGKDLDRALQKAIDIESIPKQIKAIEDPFGAAIDTLNDKFKDLIRTLDEAQGTSAQLADAEKLYGLERAEIVKQYGEAATATLKGFLDDLKGSDAFSLRDQEAQAKAMLQPFITAIDAGQSIDQDKYTAAADRFLNVERELYGSTEAYFEALAMIQGETNRAIATIEKVTPIRDETSPFAKATADATAATAANTEAAADIASQQTAVLLDVRTLLQQIAAGGGSGFIGSVRNFA